MAFHAQAFLKRAIESIQFQISKHGQYRGMESVEEAVNSLSNFELLQLIADAHDNWVMEQT